MAIKKVVLLSIFVLLFSFSARAETATNWPVDFANPQTLLSSAFGPRLKASEDYRYDYHRGIDIPGETTDEAISIKDGTVYRIYAEGDPDSTYPNSGNIVIVKHQFDEPYSFHGISHTIYYSLYAHLSSFAEGLEEGDTVTAGQTVGYIGKSGTTDFLHLHFEIRVGTTCSMEIECNHGYDPHINPLNFLPYTQENEATGSASVSGADVLTSITIPYDELDLNSFRVRTYNSNDTLLQNKLLNFDTREGSDPSSDETLDQQEYNNIYIDPEIFTSSSEEETMNVTFENTIFDNVRRVNIQIKDINGNTLFSDDIYISSEGVVVEEPEPEPDPYDPENGETDPLYGIITNIDKQEENLLITYEDGTEHIITPFINNADFAYQLSTDKYRLLTTNGKFIRVFKNSVKVDQKKIHKKYLPKRSYKMKVANFYSAYDNVIFASKKQTTGKIAVFRLDSADQLIKRQIRNTLFHLGKLNRLKIILDKKRFKVIVRKNHLNYNYVWRIRANGTLIKK
ncbi:MAG: M23 family metallopeptidase [Patescibacteria group bacterium]|jgi:hypothetical protein